jgi:hypothetical protein
MNDFCYSDEADEILHFFYGADVMVYVEGDDDVPFWEVVFKKITEFKVEVQEVGGSEELEKYIHKVENGNFKGLIACDSDFEALKKNEYHRNVIRTYGYSIENSFINNSSILKIIKNIGRIPTKKLPTNELEEWELFLKDAFKSLIVYDVFNELNSLGISVVGDNFSKFFKGKNSFEICTNKLNDYISSIGFNIDEAQELDVLKTIKSTKREVYDFIRGHFLFSAVFKS